MEHLLIAGNAILAFAVVVLWLKAVRLDRRIEYLERREARRIHYV